MDVRLGPDRQLSLPAEVCERYGLEPRTPVRIVETRSGILLVPLTDAPMTAELERELAEWQAAGAHAWDLLPYKTDQ